MPKIYVNTVIGIHRGAQCTAGGAFVGYVDYVGYANDIPFILLDREANIPKGQTILVANSPISRLANIRGATMEYLPDVGTGMMLSWGGIANINQVIDIGDGTTMKLARSVPGLPNNLYVQFKYPDVEIVSLGVPST